MRSRGARRLELRPSGGDWELGRRASRASTQGAGHGTRRARDAQKKTRRRRAPWKQEEGAQRRPTEDRAERKLLACHEGARQEGDSGHGRTRTHHLSKQQRGAAQGQGAERHGQEKQGAERAPSWGSRMRLGRAQLDAQPWEIGRREGDRANDLLRMEDGRAAACWR